MMRLVPDRTGHTDVVSLCQTKPENRFDHFDATIVILLHGKV